MVAWQTSSLFRSGVEVAGPLLKAGVLLSYAVVRIRFALYKIRLDIHSILMYNDTEGFRASQMIVAHIPLIFKTLNAQVTRIKPRGAKDRNEILWHAGCSMLDQRNLILTQIIEEKP